MNLIDVLKIQFPNADFRSEIILQDDGNGAYIKQWNLQGISEPSQDQINQWINDPTMQQQHTFKQNAIANIPILDQLEEIDKQSIRALREPGTQSTIKLQNLTAQAVALRAQLLPTS